MEGKQIVFVTGANTGLGLEVVRALCKSTNAYDIFLGSRSTQKGDDAVKSVEKEFPGTQNTFTVIQIDVLSDQSIEQAVKSIASKVGKIDVLINNAGGSFDSELQDKQIGMREAWDRSWSLNVTSAQVVTHLCVPLLLKSTNARLIFVTSGTACLSETESTENPVLLRNNGSPTAGWPKPKQPLPIAAYRSAKTGLNMLMREWHRVLKNDGVKVWCVMPGFLATNFGPGSEDLKQLGAMEPSEGGRVVAEVVEGARDNEVGKVIRPKGLQPW